LSEFVGLHAFEVFELDDLTSLPYHAVVSSIEIASTTLIRELFNWNLYFKAWEIQLKPQLDTTQVLFLLGRKLIFFWFRLQWSKSE
jgi:hypothetical protein